MSSDVRWLHEVGQADAAAVGGKGAHLGELMRIDGITVPAGFCVTTEAFRRLVAPVVEPHLEQLGDPRAVHPVSERIRDAVEHVAIPDDLATAITEAVAQLGADGSYAVRSSATAEDLPTASFAGQQDTYLNVTGPVILTHVRRCWASLYSERAITYRVQHGYDHRSVQMGVVVQRMVPAEVSGVLFTADPLTGNRRVATVEAIRGLGEALVAGHVTPDSYQVRDGEVIARALAQDRPVLSDAQLLQLVQLGRRIEQHFGRPQDIEWCLTDDFAIVQSRPITTLFPVPARSDDDPRVYVSVGHQQMMTDPIKPLGISIWQLTAGPPMYEAGARLFVDVTDRLRSPAARAVMLDLINKAEPIIGDALQTVVDRGFLPPLDGDAAVVPVTFGSTPMIDPDASIPRELIAHSEASVAALRRDISTRSGPELFDFILADLQELKRILFNPRSHAVFLTAMDAAAWLNEHLLEWLGEKNAADVLTQSVPDNVSSEMGLALLDVADAIRPHPEVVAFLEGVDHDAFLDDLALLPGGPESRAAIDGFLDMYGMRCVGEIDVTRPRWSERPSALVPLILGNIRSFEPGAGARLFEQGRQQAAATEQDLLARLHELPDGEQKATDAKLMIDRVRTFMGYREYPKYDMVRRYFVYKQALLGEAERLVEAGVLSERDDIFFLRFEELHEVSRTGKVDDELLRRRQEEFRSYAALTPPRVLTSEGEAIRGSLRRTDAPAGALVGLAVSGGTVEGRARVILDMAEADVEPGDILVTAFTDPSWSPLFPAVAGLVTEVGGLMTHGAVVAREYGLPAVVAVERATRRIRDGQRIRVNGTDGYVEVLG